MSLTQNTTSKATEASLPPYADGVNLCLAQLLHYQKQAIHWLPPALSIWSQLNGQHHSHQQGRGMNFSEVRLYQPGDDVRSIDWRVTARTGKTHTKLFTEEREQPVMLLVDLSTSMKFGSELLLKSVQAAHFSTLLSWLAVSQNDRIGAIIFNGIKIIECKPTGRKQGPLRIMHALIEAHIQMLQAQEMPISPEHWQEALRHLHHLCPKGSEIVVISDFYSLSQEDKRRLAQLRQHNRIQFVHIVDPLEQGQTAFRGQELVSDNRSTAWLDFSSKRTREALKTHYLTHLDFVSDIAKSLAIPLHFITAARPLLQQLNRTKIKVN